MKYVNINSKKGLVNLFADYLLKHFNSDTIIEVMDCGPFFVVMGETSKKEIVDLSKVKESFLIDNKTLSLENINLIDLIKYNIESKNEPRWFKYYPTSRPIYSEDDVSSFISENESSKYDYKKLSVTSEFPHGYGLNKGRFDFYFGEYVSNHLFNLTNADSMEIFYNKDEIVEDLKLQISLGNSHLNTFHVWDLMLDVFYTDENINIMLDKINSYDILKDLTEPLNAKPWLIKNKSEDMFII